MIFFREKMVEWPRAISGHGRRESIKRRKHPCRSGRFGVLQGQALAHGFRQFARQLGMLRMRFATVGCLGLIRAPLIVTRACRRSEDLGQSMRVSSTAAPD